MPIIWGIKCNIFLKTKLYSSHTVFMSFCIFDAVKISGKEYKISSMWLLTSIFKLLKCLLCSWWNYTPVILLVQPWSKTVTSKCSPWYFIFLDPLSSWHIFIGSCISCVTDVVIYMNFFPLTDQKVIDILFDLFVFSAQFYIVSVFFVFLTFQLSDGNLQIVDISLISTYFTDDFTDDICLYIW